MGNRKQMASLLVATPLLAAKGNRRIYRHLPSLPGKVWSENQCVLSLTFPPSQGPVSVLWTLYLCLFMELGDSWQESECLHSLVPTRQH